MRGAPTEDLRAELNRRHARAGTQAPPAGAQEYQRNIEVRNLDPDFAVVQQKSPGAAQASPGTVITGVGCAALADNLRTAKWPSKFRPHLPEKYDGTSNPSEFLQVYVTAIIAAGGDDAVMASYFHVALSGPPRTWLMNLPPRSIFSWEELCSKFTANFTSACQLYGVEAHLHAVRQEPGESLRVYITRFAKIRGTIPRISDASVITAF